MSEWQSEGEESLIHHLCTAAGERPLPDVQVLERRPQAEPRDPVAVHQGDDPAEPGLALEGQVPPHLGAGGDHVPGILRGRNHSGTQLKIEAYGHGRASLCGVRVS